MNGMLDVVASMVIGGIVLMMLLGFNTTINEGAANQFFKTNVQSKLTTITDIMEYDLRKIGYGVQDTNYFLYADSSRIDFRGDLDNNGIVDTMKLYVGTVRDSSKVNPRARILYRKFGNGATQSINLAMTQFKLCFYDKAGSPLISNPVANPEKIKSVKLSVSIESDAPYNQQYSGACWERTIKPKNIK